MNAPIPPWFDQDLLVAGDAATLEPSPNLRVTSGHKLALGVFRQRHGGVRTRDRPPGYDRVAGQRHHSLVRCVLRGFQQDDERLPRDRSGARVVIGAIRLVGARVPCRGANGTWLLSGSFRVTDTYRASGVTSRPCLRI